MPKALIFANGDLSHPTLARSLVQPDDYIIAADGGARHALSIGITPAIIIGDLDSLTEAEVKIFSDQNVRILRFPPAKDETDLELALLHALHTGYNTVMIIAAFGGRLDQALGNIALLASPEAICADVRLDDGATEAFFVRDSALINGTPGDIVSLIPWGNLVEGVVTKNLVYPLNNETLFPYRTRSISNEMLAQTASVSIGNGLLLCVHLRKNETSKR
jgi:thiamine pyrophosphokinase